MKDNNIVTEEVTKTEAESESEVVTELSEEMELVGPGGILAEARKAKGLTQQEVAEKLNFRVALVADLEAERFDKSLPETFNRGYLRNYAKFVGVNVNDVLTSYEVLHVAEKQGAEMMSFSRGTSIKAENNRIMWASYFILAAFITSTVVWWVQDESKTDAQSQALVIASADNDDDDTLTELSTDDVLSVEHDGEGSVTTDIEQKLIESSELEAEINSINLNDDLVIETALTDEDIIDAVEVLNSTVEADTSVESEAPKTLLTTAPVDVQFTFVGDCWVDIYDGNGEHVAWGIKKSGYVMNISAIPPIEITLGKPELVAIKYENSDVDMSKYRKGNIAKFTLPLTP